jgi:uncharacterized protein YwqG
MMQELPEYRMFFVAGPIDPQIINQHRYGERSKLGGKPDWEQNEETPKCPCCGQEMTFVAQIDSINHDSKDNPYRVDCLSDDQKYMFGDVGLIYIFFCFDCLETKSLMQCG